MLHHTCLTAPGAHPGQWMLFLHGILGAGHNWRSFARRFVDACPAWGAALIDLRMHGASQQQPPPHSISSAAADLHALGPILPGPIRAVLGHSFGGKVALRFLAEAPAALSTAWIIDSSPSARTTGRGSEEVLRAMAALRALGPGHVYDSRAAFVSRLQAHGLDAALSHWLAMNLQRHGATYRLHLKLDAIDDLLGDHFRTDLWGALCPPPPGVSVHLVIGDRSDIFTEADRDHARRCGPAVMVHTLPAGHFVHVDDPDGLLSLMQAVHQAHSPF